MTAVHKSRIYACSVVGLPLLAFTISFFGATFGYRLFAQRASAAKPLAGNATVHTLYGGFRRTDGSFVSTLRIQDVLIAEPMQVTPTLYMADGTPYTLAPVDIPKGGVATIDINQALAQAPESVARHVSQIGSTSLVYTYPTGGHVNASTLTLDVPHSLTFSYSFMAMMGPNAKPANPKDMKRMPRPGHHVLEGLWWKRDPGVTGFLVLSNATEKEEIATVSAEDAPEDSGRAIALRPHETRLIHLDELGNAAVDPHPHGDGQHQAGGIRIEYDGMMGDVSVSGDLLNQSEGYSARIPLWDTDTTSKPPAKTSYASAGLMLGQPDPMMMPGFPPQTRFAPYLVLRNTTAQAMNLEVGANYMSAGGAPVSIQLPPEILRPFEAKQVDLSDELNSAGLAGFNGAINLAVVFTGKAGDLIVATGSVDQTGTYVFEVAPQAVSKTNRKIGSYWNAANGNDTMFTLWNPTDSAQDIAMTFYYADGSGAYNLPVHLKAQASSMIDIGVLKMEGTLDASGKPFRQDVNEGSVSFASAHKATWMTLVSSIGTFNTTTATCGETCIQCCGDSGMAVNPGPLQLEMGAGPLPVELDGQNCQGPDDGIPVDQWDTTNSDIATVDADGNVNPVSPGSVTITAESSDYTGPDFQQCADGQPQCPDDEPDNDYDDTANVTPVIDSISPGKGPISGTVSVTITGSGFGTGGATVNAGSGITVNITSNGDTQIQANFQISSTATGGNASVTVTANGQTSNTVNFYIQIPTSLSIVPGTDSTSSESSCSGGFGTGCGIARTFTYQVNDQTGQPIQYAGLEVWDSIAITSPNNLAATGFATTCTFDGQTNSGPCGRTTDSSGQFPESPGLTVCAAVCRSNNMCVTGGPTSASQSFHIGPSIITQSIGYYCDHITVNGQ